MPQRRNILLKIPSVFYGWGVTLRNIAFDNGILKSKPAPLPTICVGNLSAGGTGKTPHIEFLIRHLSKSYKLAVLSRGYKRKSSTPMFAEVDSRVEDVGDEPLQIKQKFPEVLVYIDGNRMRAVQKLASMPEESRPEVILMDDGYQHRYLKSTYSILLTPFNNPFTRDDLLPYGNLREPASGKYRANSVILTKTPLSIKPIDYKLIEGELELHAYQDLYYSHVKVMSPLPICPKEETEGEPSHSPLKRGSSVILVAGIAHPETFIERQKAEGYKVKEELIFSDHHVFSATQLEHMVYLLESISDCYLLTTEKDAIRLRPHIEAWPKQLRERCYYVPIEVTMRSDFTNSLVRNIKKAIREARG